LAKKGQTVGRSDQAAKKFCGLLGRLHFIRKLEAQQMIDLTPKQMLVMGEVEKVAADMRVTQMLRARRDEILAAIGNRTCEPTLEILFELGQLDDALGIAPMEFPDEQ
jgi:hypothetical protein